MQSTAQMLAFTQRYFIYGAFTTTAIHFHKSVIIWLENLAGKNPKLHSEYISLHENKGTASEQICQNQTKN